eukprot:GEMP01032538.1.p1 GENE.GEMP01032538.1~~GEMP01032538.1.p1  ORF type:complete len:423 (+),score=78.74 GEMP01032538.1:145-1413(+)
MIPIRSTGKSPCVHRLRFPQHCPRPHQQPQWQPLQLQHQLQQQQPPVPHQGIQQLRMANGFVKPVLHSPLLKFSCPFATHQQKSQQPWQRAQKQPQLPQKSQQLHAPPLFNVPGRHEMQYSANIRSAREVPPTPRMSVFTAAWAPLPNPKLGGVQSTPTESTDLGLGAPSSDAPTLSAKPVSAVATRDSRSSAAEIQKDSNSSKQRSKSRLQPSIYRAFERLVAKAKNGMYPQSPGPVDRGGFSNSEVTDSKANAATAVATPEKVSARPDDDASPNNGDCVRDAKVIRQPGDGSCLFHSLAYGLDGVAGHGAPLRKEIARFIETNPNLDVAGTPLKDWVAYDDGGTVEQYAAHMAGEGWGGGIEMTVLSHLKRVNIQVFEKHRDGYKRISVFDCPGAARKTISVLYQGRMHYDALEISKYLF